MPSFRLADMAEFRKFKVWPAKMDHPLIRENSLTDFIRLCLVHV